MSEEPGSKSSVGPGARGRAKAPASDEIGAPEGKLAQGGAETSGAAPAPATKPGRRRAAPRVAAVLKLASRPPATATRRAPESVVSALATPAPEAVPVAAERRIEATTVTITQGGAAEVEADSIQVNRGGIGAASAEDITVTSGGIGLAQADDIAVRMGAIGFARGEHVSTELGAIGFALGGDVSVTQGFARTVLARDVNIRQGAAGTVVANHVTLGEQTGTLVLLARKVEGDVRTVLDWRGALAAGAALGIVVGLLARRRHD